MSSQPLFITETILRDAHQSQAATRMRTEEMLPACALLDGMGYWSVECWGGATFDACLRFLDEDPWERLRALRRAMPNTRLQMLLRGQNLLGYRNYPDDVVDSFCKKSLENGIDVVRIFDALNDTRNLSQAMKSVKEYGGLCEPAISYTVSPIHSEQCFIDLALRLEEMGADVICIKDMSNLLLPMDAYRLIQELKKRVSVPIHLHTHNTSGTGDMTYLMATLAGVDIVDCALSPLGSGTAQPATESLVAALRGQERDTGLDLAKLSEAAQYFRGVADRLEKDGFLDPKVLRVDPNALIYQVPGGMLSNLISQLKEAKAEDKYEEVLAEVPKVREDFGYPPLVTPTSQIVGTQAVFNVLLQERYKMASRESKALLRGEYGQLPGAVGEAVRKKVIGEDKVITCRPADLLPPEMEVMRKEADGLARSEEDVLSLAMLPQAARNYLERRNARFEAALRREQRAKDLAREQKRLVRGAETNGHDKAAGPAAGNPMARNCKI
ncbi:MAG TPA: pyruvate carboxylase subunit B [Anaerovoracaceae bacterium]|nr:pyruvate carboxylase subunit B [Anaerovoracaceae bacterium]